MEIDCDKLAAAILRQQLQQPPVTCEVAVLNSPEQDRGVRPQTQVLVRNIDDLKEILVDAEAKGIKTHKERDKKQFKEILQILLSSSESKFITQIRKKKTTTTTRKRLSILKNVLNVISQSELNILWRGKAGGGGGG